MQEPYISTCKLDVERHHFDGYYFLNNNYNIKYVFLYETKILMISKLPEPTQFSLVTEDRMLISNAIK